MRRTLLALFLIAATACGGTGQQSHLSIPRQEAGGTTEPARTVSIYAAVLRRLLSDDNSGERSHWGFKVVYVLDGAVERAEDPDVDIDRLKPWRAFSNRVKEGIREALSDLPPVTFVQERGSVIGGAAPGQVVNAGILATVGPIAGHGTRVEVGANSRRNGLAGRWQRYVVELQGGAWE